MKRICFVFTKVKDIFFKIFGKARWFVLAMAICYPAYLILVVMQYSILDTKAQGGAYYIPHYIEKATVNSEGFISVYDYSLDRPTIALKNPETGEQKCFDDCHRLVGGLFNEYEFKDIIAGEGDTFYALIYTQTYRTEYILEEKIISFKTDLNGYEEICSFYHEDGPERTDMAYGGLRFEDGTLNFSYTDYKKAILYSFDTKSGTLSESREYVTDENGTYTFSVIPLGGLKDEFVFLRCNGKAYRTSFDEPIGEEWFSFGEGMENPTPSYIERLGEDDYVITADSAVLYKLNGDKMEEVTDAAVFLENPLVVASNLDQYGGKLLVTTTDGCIYYENGNIELLDLASKCKPGYQIKKLAEYILRAISVISAICLVINLIIRKKTILYKHLISVLPIIAILIIVVANFTYKRGQQEQFEDVSDQASAICEIAAARFSGENFTDLTSLGEHSGEASVRIRQKLLQLTSNHKNEWSQAFEFLVVTVNRDGKIIPLSSDTELIAPLTKTTGFEGEQLKTLKDGEILTKQSIYSEISSKALSEVYAIGKIDNETPDLYLLVKADNKGLWFSHTSSQFLTMIFVGLIYLVLAFIILLNAVNVTRGIKKASKTVNRIAEGDLSARANFKATDELGDICAQVDGMAGSLQAMFEEKDRTEKFYYKFVPEQFRKFLDKENFTDLQLGDAKSRELTILFCDIRSFSINSEIMTAKENFEFINKVYGVAGPIVRNHNGFVDKYIGDAVMALFENADDALRCGIEMQREIVGNKKMAESLGVSGINIGIGIHSGMAMIGIVGEEERLSGTVISDTVNLSSRLESLTKQFKTGILVSKDTVDRLSDTEEYNLRYLGILQVAGVNEVKGVYEVLDCLPENIKSERQSHREKLREAIRLFHLGERKESVSLLSEINSDKETDGVIAMYREYIEGLPEEEQGNVFRFTRK